MEDGTTSWKDLPIVLIPGTASWNDLPTSLTIDILTRLPVKTLIRCTSLAKSWYALITNPKFISTHINRSISYAANKNADHYLLLCPTSLNSCSLICEKTTVTLENFEIPFRTQSQTVQIVGSCNGLLCLTDNLEFHFGRHVYLWNPSIRKHRTLGSSCISSELSDWMTTYPVVGFGFHEPASDYRVVRIVYFADSHFNFLGKVAPKIEVYSLRTDSWRRVVATVPRTANNGTATHVSGAIYWLAAKKAHDPYESVMFFDLNDEAFRELKLPPNYLVGVGQEKCASITLTEFLGSLSLCVACPTEDYGVSQRCCIWVMRENGAAVSWTKQFKVVLQEKVGWPLGFTKSGKLMLAVIGRIRESQLKNLVSCNLENLKYTDLGNDGPYTVDAAFMESLVLLERGTVLSKHAK